MKAERLTNLPKLEAGPLMIADMALLEYPNASSAYRRELAIRAYLWAKENSRDYGDGATSTPSFNDLREALDRDRS